MSKRIYFSKFESSRPTNSIVNEGCAENTVPFNKNWSTYPVPRVPTKNCIFCKEFHWSHLCLEVPTLEKRKHLFEIFGLCLLCGKRQHADSCSYADIWCKWPQCGQKNVHNSTLCPNIDYPMNEAMVQAYKDHVDYVWKLRAKNESPMNNLEDTSQYTQRKDRKRNRKLTTKAKTLTFGCHNKMVT